MELKVRIPIIIHTLNDQQFNDFIVKLSSLPASVKECFLEEVALLSSAYDPMYPGLHPTMNEFIRVFREDFHQYAMQENDISHIKVWIKYSFDEEGTYRFVQSVLTDNKLEVSSPFPISKLFELSKDLVDAADGVPDAYFEELVKTIKSI